MNYFVPIMIGSPDYKTNVAKLTIMSKKLDSGNNSIPILRKLPPLSHKGVYCRTTSTSKTQIDLRSYLAGLWEGDGHIIVNKKTTPVFAINFHIKDLPLVLKLLKIIGGNIRYKYKENAVVLIITSRSALLNIVNLINGYLRTPKIYEFNLLIHWLNDKMVYEPDYPALRGGTGIPQYPVDRSFLGSNSWLAGFLDADSGFKIRYTEKFIDLTSARILRKQRLEVSMALEQRKLHPKTNEPFSSIMKLIADFFNVNLKTSLHHGSQYWCIELTSLNKLKILKDYLENHPMLTSKSNDYSDWLIVYNMIEKKEHLIPTNLKKIKQIKDRMNRNRKNFDWSHLKNHFNDSPN